MWAIGHGVDAEYFLPHFVTVRIVDLLPQLFVSLPSCHWPDGSDHYPGAAVLPPLAGGVTVRAFIQHMSVSDYPVREVSALCSPLPPRGD